MEKYTKVKSIGKGNMGTCTLARNNEDGLYYVIKQVDLTRMSRKDRQQSLSEARVLSSLRHPNIINYVDSFLARKSDNLCIVMEYADGGDLSGRIKKNYGVNLPERQILDWLIQLVLSLQYVHQRKILHRDVKSQNVFLTADNIVKLGDFGIARTLSNTYDQARTFVGTPYYLSPELILERPYDHRSDIWALGVVLYEMMALKHPFNAADMKGLLHRILSVQYDPVPSMYSADLRAILERILVKEPSQRIELEELLQLPIIQNRLREWTSEVDAVPARYLDSLRRHNLLRLPGLSPVAAPSPSPSANVRRSSLPSSATLSEHTDPHDSDMPQLSLLQRYPVKASAARAAMECRDPSPAAKSSASEEASSHRTFPPNNGAAYPHESRYASPSAAAVPRLSPIARQEKPSGPPSRAPSSPTPPKQYELDGFYRQLNARKSTKQGNAPPDRYYARPYVVPNRFSPSPYLGRAPYPVTPTTSGRRTLATLEGKRSQVGHASLSRTPSNPAHVARLPSMATPTSLPYSKLTPPPPPQSDIKAMLHKAALERAKRRKEFY